ncbi:MAG: CoA pyrophosphatase [Bacteroidetes bacterium]|nr:MAG: CoA pyrophosphatase [Bacteroidota bacterium]
MDFAQKLKQTLLQELPGESFQYRMAPVSRPRFQESQKLVENYRESAVAVILHQLSQEEHGIILIQRPEYKGSHSGQVSFPGGKKEHHDDSLLETAQRECHEEIGLELNAQHYLGQLSPVLIPVSGFHVEPHVFFHDDLPQLEADPREVQHIFNIRTNELLDDQNIRQTKIKLESGAFLRDVPYFDLERKVIWGATALILSELKEVLRRSI